MAMARHVHVALVVTLLLFLFGQQRPASALTSGDDWHYNFPSPPVVAIDVGNTNSCVAGYVANTMFQLCIPSWVAFTANGTVLVGDDAREHAAVDPGSAISGFKRLIGKRWKHMYDTEVVQRMVKEAPYKLVEKNLYPRIQVKTGYVDTGGAARTELSTEEITAMVIRKLREAAESYTGRPVRHAVLTVPRHFHDAPCTHARFAGHIAKVRVARMLDEPIAAAVAHGLHRRLPNGGVALVLHVGGATTEASLMVLQDGVFDFLGGRHDVFLGGDDFDRRVTDHFAALIKQKHGMDISNDTAALAKLRTSCEQAKKALSTRRQAQVVVESLIADGVDFAETLTRAKFEELNGDLFGKVVKLLHRAMVGADHELDRSIWDAVDEVLLVGGSAMIPEIQRLVRDYFGGRKKVAVHAGVKPDEVVTLGGALLTRADAGGYPCMGVDGRRQTGYHSDWCDHPRWY